MESKEKLKEVANKKKEEIKMSCMSILTMIVQISKTWKNLKQKLKDLDKS
jgi:hypothetical protein